MRKLLLPLLAAIAFAGIIPFAEPQAPKIPDPPPIPGKFFTGATPTPFQKIAASIKAGTASIHQPLGAPPQVVTVPKRLSYWGNNQYGCCVTSESVFAIADYSTAIGMEEIFVTDSTMIAWARAHGVLNGADLLDVIQNMQRDGIKDEKGVLRKAGKPSAVDFSNEENLKSAIAQGPVSIAIASSSLPSGAGNKSGWSAFGGRSNRNTDHCVCLHGYGPTSELFKALNVSAPANAPANGYLLFTWSTIGVVDHQWLMNTCVEAWVRNPTVLDLAPTPPPLPPPSTITVSVSSYNAGSVGTPTKITALASGGTSPYLLLFDYGDNSRDGAGTHTYNAAGSYTVTVTAIDVKGQVGMGTGLATISTGPTPPPPPPPLPPGPNGVGTIQWTIGGVTSSYELMPIGSRQKLQEILGLIAP